MGVRPRNGTLAAGLVLALVACGGSTDGGADRPPSATSSAPTETWDLVVLADSSGWGLGDAWADLIRRDEGVDVNVTDLSTGMQSGSMLLQHLTTDGDPQREAVRDAEVISVWGSPSGLVWDSDVNDCVMYPDGTRPPSRISRKDMAPFAEMWRDILSEIASLREGQPTALRTRDIYNPVLRRELAGGTAEACAAGLRTMSAIIRAATRRVGGTFVPVNRAFNGPTGLRDPRGQGVFEDAEHLSDKGVALLAQVHHDAGYEELRNQ